VGDRLQADKLSRYVTSHPGQLSLQGGQQCWALWAFLVACPCMLFIDILSLFINLANKDVCLLAILLWVGAMSTSLGWEGNRRSGQEMSTSPTLLRSMVLLCLYLLLL